MVACIADGVDVDADERECNGIKPETERACYSQCANSIEYKWRTGQWGAVSTFHLYIYFLMIYFPFFFHYNILK